jgi:ubiquinone/menaquinone biosynthesis C-methylase UbiE
MADQLFTDGKAYERLMGRWSRLAGAAFLDWLNVPQAMRWLDAGCGNGATAGRRGSRIGQADGGAHSG